MRRTGTMNLPTRIFAAMTPQRMRHLVAGVVACALAPAAAFAQNQHACTAPPELVRLASPLVRTAQRLATGQPVTIVAVGSSSTFGAGASSPAAAYPARLEAELQARFPHSQITVINRGVNGDEAREMLARFTDSVIRQKPDLVLWQVGTNAVLRNDIAPTGPLILKGLAQLKELGVDVIVIDPQYAPSVLAKRDVEQMLGLISAATKQTDVDLFPRFAIMRYWMQHEHMTFTDFISPDKLHMNDWGYACLAKLIGGAITEAAQRDVATAQVQGLAHTMAQ
jgi:lysophospholipase L1-like esterase